MAGGWIGKILDVDLSTGAISDRDTMAYANKYVGGRAMASRLAWESIARGTAAYAPENCIIIVTGPLSGTLAPTTGRTVMSGVSPRPFPNEWYTHSTLGGWFGPELKYAGYDAIIIRGRALEPVILQIHDGAAQIVSASDFWGLDARKTQIALRASFDPQAQVLAIGPAGENLVRFASVQHAEENAAGHSGFGAVWGSKLLKAVAVRGTGCVEVAEPEALLCEIRDAGTFTLVPAIATVDSEPDSACAAELLPVCSQACTFDCRVQSPYGRRKDGRRVPGWCIGGMFLKDTGMANTGYSGGDIEVPQCPNFGAEDEVRFHEMCNSQGLDLWFRLILQPWLIRCQQLGIATIRGYAIEPEESSWFLRFTEEVAARQGLGAVFAQDLRRAMDELEGELPAELIHLGRELTFDFGFPAHREGRLWDEEPLPFWIISAMMHLSEGRDPTIGAHASSLLQEAFLRADRDAAIRQFRRLSEAVWGFPDGLDPTFEHKAPVAVWSQDQHMLIDSLPMCDFAFPQLVRSMGPEDDWRTTDQFVGDLELDLRLLNAVTGCSFDRGDLTRAARRSIAIERVMLAREGRHRMMEKEALAPHFGLPCRADGTSIDEAGLTALMDQYYSERGWDLVYGWPTVSQLENLGLGDVAADLAKLSEQ